MRESEQCVALGTGMASRHGDDLFRFRCWCQGTSRPARWLSLAGVVMLKVGLSHPARISLARIWRGRLRSVQPNANGPGVAPKFGGGVQMFKKLIALPVLAMMLTVIYVSCAQAARDIGGRPLTQRELHRLYAGKTWLWKEGGGYFDRSGRFHGDTNFSRKRSRVKGGWGVYRRGKVCFSGLWKLGPWKSFDSSCFLHRRVGNKIYQRRLPVGSWFLFRDLRNRKKGEYRKLARGRHEGWYVKYRSRSLKRKRRSRYAKRARYAKYAHKRRYTRR